jgi:ABC-2 family transporter protein
MRSVSLMLGKDARLLGRSRLLLAGLIIYPLLIALVVGLLVRYAGERPRVAFVDQAGLPSVVRVGDQTFALREMFEHAAEVRLVTMSPAQAAQELDSGRILATLVIPRNFTDRLMTMQSSPRIVLRTTRSGLATRVVEKVRALVYSLNLRLQHAYITANLAAVDLLLRGGSGNIGKTRFTLLGLDRAKQQLAVLARSRDPAVATSASKLGAFVEQLRGAVGQVGVFLRATANPIVLTTATRSGRAWLLSAQIQIYALALTLAFVAILLGAAVITVEREDAVIARLTRSLVKFGSLLTEKVLFATLVATMIAVALALVFGAIVASSGQAGGEPWSRFPLLVLGLITAAAAFSAFGVLLGTLGRDSGTATLLALLVALPLSLLGVAPGGNAGAAWAADLFPFGHATRVFSAALYDPAPAGTIAHGMAWLVLLAAAYGSLARLGARRLVD